MGLKGQVGWVGEWVWLGIQREGGQVGQAAMGWGFCWAGKDTGGEGWGGRSAPLPSNPTPSSWNWPHLVSDGHRLEQPPYRHRSADCPRAGRLAGQPPLPVVLEAHTHLDNRGHQEGSEGGEKGEPDKWRGKGLN